MASVLYITYDGILEPLGQSQVLQYLKRLAAEHSVTLLSYEKPADWADEGRRSKLQDEVRAAGICWTALTYHRRPSVPATAYDVAVGMAVGFALALRRRVRIVHARSYVPAVIALVLKRALGVRFVFDMRGFWPDEKAESGAWRTGSLVYRVAKAFERRFLLEADVVVSLTHAGVAAMRAFPYLAVRKQRFEVIPTCADLERFKPIETVGLPPARPFTVGCVGSVGLWYLFDEMLACFNALRAVRPDARLVILNRDSHAYIRERLFAQGVPPEIVALKAVDYTEVAAEMNAMDAGLFFIRPIFSKTGSAPTKLAEFLGCGVPCLANAGVGDYERILEGERVGVALRGFGDDERQRGVRRLLDLAAEPDVRRRCVETARRHFSLREGVERYHRIYQELTAA